MGVKIREKRGRLYLDIYHEGKRTWEALGLTMTKDKAQNKEIMRLADICRSKRESQLLAGKWEIQDPVSSKKKLITYLEDYSKTYKTPATVKSCIRHLKNYADGETINLGQITPHWLMGFQRYLSHNAGLSPASAWHYEKILRAALNKAADEGLIPKNPADEVKRIQAPPEPELIFLDIEEIRKLARTPRADPTGAEVCRAFLFACYTGLRVSDLETITWGQIQRNPMQIIKRQEKTQNPVYVPLSSSAQKLIETEKKHDPGENLFHLPPEKRRATYWVLKQWAKDAGIPKNIGWHTARRTFATMALEAGADIFTVAELLGHNNIKQVARYAKVTDKLRRGAVDALPELER